MMYAPSPRTANLGVPPTAPNARTGVFTPPGITRLARSNSSSEPVTSGSGRQPVGGVLRVVREDQIGAGAPDRGEHLEHDGAFVEPAVLGGRLHHRVLARDVVRGRREPRPVLGTAD